MLKSFESILADTTLNTYDSFVILTPISAYCHSKSILRWHVKIITFCRHTHVTFSHRPFAKSIFWSRLSVLICYQISIKASLIESHWADDKYLTRNWLCALKLLFFTIMNSAWGEECFLRWSIFNSILIWFPAKDQNEDIYLVQ